MGRQSYFHQTRGEFVLLIPLFVQPLLKKLLGYESSLRETIYSVSAFNVDVAIFADFECDITLLDKILGKVAELEAHE